MKVSGLRPLFSDAKMTVVWSCSYSSTYASSKLWQFIITSGCFDLYCVLKPKMGAMSKYWDLHFAV